MIAVAIAVVVLLVAAAAAGVCIHSRRLRVRSRVLVSLKTGNAVSGVIIRSAGAWIVVADAAVHDRDASRPTPADGEIWIERVNVDYVQAAGGER
ncbi:hypothetical protein C8K38_111208 [Rhodococcus sp. OK611]|uniref:hypothetical protein n=1 Tax=unclassified Rhodococcus (in: high G+C Gram-positive bacteria) TaxID=192944 RepID=UPI000BCE1F34|nr:MULTISPECIES: hypothetical protein [unclassified Rhodococcus (in: high G+C Gram-positive bacteria)]PTR42039.1 hypothetical protein C8K38_111208 [Rhodococcus sp. OK611]SNX91514.1 hypothetical protein SAMN05447004_11049 [Rhodococcus sp. OK270]